MCEVADWIMLILLVVCGFCDWRRKELPLPLLLAMSAITVFFVIGCGMEDISRKIGGLLIGAMMFGVSKFTREAVGYGDSWMIAILGFYLGDWDVLQLLFVASVAAAIGSLFYLWKGRWKKGATIPFVPFLVIAYVGVVFV